MHKPLHIIFLLFLPVCIFGQQTSKNDSLPLLNKKYNVIPEKGLTELVELYTSTFKQPGYRIQICSESSKKKVEQAKSRFISKYDSCTAYESYQAPAFKIRVGDFLTRMEASGFRQKILGDFPDAFVVNVPEIKFEKDK